MNWIQIKLDLNWIKEKWMKIDVQDIENMLVIMVLNFFIMKIHRFEFTPFYSSLIENQLNKFEFEIIIQEDDLWNLNLFLPKPILMNL